MDNKEILELQTKSFVTDVLAQVDTAGHFRDIMGFIMREMGIFTHAERVCVYEHDMDKVFLEKVYEWNIGDDTVSDVEKQVIQRNDIINWYDELKQNHLVVMKDSDSIRNSMPAEYKIMEDRCINGLLLIPAYVDDRLIACMCIINPDFSMFAILESAFLFLGRQIGLLYHRERINHKYLLFMDGMRSSNLSEFIVDCSTNRFEAFRITKVLRNIIPEEGDWNWLRQFYASIIKPEYKEDILRRTTMEYIKTFLRTEQGNYAIDIEREVNGNNNWFRLEFSVVSLDEENNLERFLLLVKDITKMKQEEEEYRQMIKALSSIYRASAMIDLSKRLVKPIKLSGIIRQFIPNDIIPHEKMLDLFCNKMIEDDYVGSVREFLDLNTMQERFQETEILTCEYQGTQIGWGRIILIPCRNDDCSIEKVVFMVQDITEQKKREEWMQYKIEHDELTKTLNRTAFHRVTKLLDSSQISFGFLLMDIDKFKGINDTYGHDVGDEVLKRLVMVLNEKMRITDKIFRIGGDEFAIIMNGITKDQAHKVKEIINSVNDMLAVSTDNLPSFSVSAGVAFSEQGYDETLYHNADKALYRTKETTRRGCTVYEEMTDERFG